MRDMARAVDVGQWLIENKSRSIGAVACQKLTYFGQVWSLVWNGTRLVEDEFEAWPMGPVAYDLYRDFTHNRPQCGDIAGADAARLTTSDAAVMGSVVKYYGSRNAPSLIDLSHDAAWTAARGGIPTNARSNEELDLTLAVREYSRKALTSTDVPARPTDVAARCFSAAEVAREANRQDQRWASVHERLASA